MRKKNGSKWLVLSLSAVLALVLIGGAEFLSAQSKGWTPNVIRIGTAVATASNYRLGGAIAEALKGVFPIPISAQETGGSAEDCRLVASKEAEVGIVVGPTDFYAYTGKAPFKQPLRDLRSVMVVDQNPFQMVVLSNSPIKSIPDLKGRKVGVGAVGSGQDVMARAILAEFKMTYNDIKPAYIGAKLGDMLRDGELEAFFSIIAIPGPYIMELANAKKVRLLPLPEAVRDSVVKKNPFMVKTLIPKGVYEGVEADVPGVAAVSTWIVHKDLDDSFAYKMAKGILEGKDKIVAAYPGAKRFISREGALTGIAIPLHPGARKYFVETKNPGLAGVPK